MFKRCEICGAYLDPGERCDCNEAEERSRQLYEKLVDTGSYQYELRLERNYVENSEIKY